MKSLPKILIAGLGAILVPLLLLGELLRRLVAGARVKAGPAVLVYSQVIWDEVWQRPQQYAWLTSEKRSTVYCCPVQMHNLLYLGKKWKPVRRVRDGNRDLLILSPLIFSGHFKNRFIHEVNCLITAWHLRAALAPASPVYIMANTPFALRVIENVFPSGSPRRRPPRLVYDIIDDFTVFDWSPSFGKAFDLRMNELSDVVITGTGELAETRPQAEFIPCGVDFALFHTPQPVPSDLEAFPRPFIGYFGTISERIDLALIEKLALAFPRASVIMVGPVHFPSQALPRQPNIHYLGLRRHSELPGFAQAYDVALIPFRITEATLKLNPVKTLEYLAAGVPVVATRLPDLERFFSDAVSIADSADEFVARVGQALELKDDQKIRTGVALAREASWEAMVDRMNTLLFATGPPKGRLEPVKAARP